jgi:hypothetical protein
MFKTTQELLDFIENAKKAHIKSFRIGDVEVQFSDIAFIDSIQQLGDSQVAKEERSTSKTLTDTLEAEEDEELLMWSAKT